MRTLTPKKYLRLGALVCVLALSGVLTFNYLVDSYDLYHPDAKWGLKSHPVLALRERLYKPYALLRSHPRTLLLGNSRVQMGIDPRNALLPQPAYNSAYGGGTAIEALLTYRFGVAQQSIDVAIMVLDPHMLFDPEDYRGDFEPARLDPTARRWIAGLRARDLVESLLTWRAFSDSLRTLRPSRGLVVRYPNGIRDLALLERDHPAAEQRAIIHRIMAEASWNRFDSRNPRQMQAVTNLIAECATHQTRLILFMSPLHAAVIESSLLNGDLLHRQFVAIQEAITASGLPVELWSFMDFNTVTMEPFPVAGAIHRMKNYWEVTHFTKSVGDMILRRILVDVPENSDLADFGHRIDVNRSTWPREEIDHLRSNSARWRHLTVSDPVRYEP